MLLSAEREMLSRELRQNLGENQAPLPLGNLNRARHARAADRSHFLSRTDDIDLLTNTPNHHIVLFMLNMSEPGSSKGGLKRINTNLSEVSGPATKSSGAKSGRLSLHIPNAHPRALTPRSATNTPKSSRPGSPTHDTAFSVVKGGPSSVSASAATEAPSANASRSSSTSRVRVFRRDSSLITIHQRDPASSPEHPSGESNSEVHLRPNTLLGQFGFQLHIITSFFSTRTTSSSSARDFLARERNFFSWLRLSCLLAILSASLILQLQLPDTAHSSSHFHQDPHRRRRRRADEPPLSWSDLPIDTKTFAAIFFVLSLLSLTTGLIDYLGAERELEKEQVDFDETEGVFLHDGHTSWIVHGVMTVVGVGILASALWLIAT